MRMWRCDRMVEKRREGAGKTSAGAPISGCVRHERRAGKQIVMSMRGGPQVGSFKRGI